MVYLINLDEYAGVGTLRIAMYVLNNDATYFDIFGVKHVPRDNRGFIGNKNMQTNIFIIQVYDSVICGYFWTGFIDYMFTYKVLIGYTRIFNCMILRRMIR